MLKKPILAQCDNRRRRARKHPNSGDPEKWLADTYLKPHGLVGLTFDFFVNWNTGSIPNQLWIKRVVDNTFNLDSIISSHDIISDLIYQCDGQEEIKNLCRFAHRYDMSCHYFIFHEVPDYQRPPFYVVEVMFDASGSVVDVQKIRLTDLVSRIQQLRGEPFRSRKSLRYALTSLECYLSKNTYAPWPGDADLVLVDADFTPIAIIEFKKDTIGTPISSETLSNYYPRNDPKKYDSFAHLRDNLTDGTRNLPIIVVYYSIIHSADQEVKLECIEGAAESLTATNSKLVPLPNARNAQSYRDFVASLIKMI